MVKQPRQGDLLIAPPNIPDPRFEKAVIMITHHDRKGSFGLCLNRASEHSVNEVIEQLNLSLTPDQQLYWGGPMSVNTIWMLHDLSWDAENTMVINSDWALTSHHSMFEIMSEGSWPRKHRICFGHAIWGPGQLAREIEGQEPYDHNHSWLILPQPDPEWLLEVDPEQLWSFACQRCSEKAVDSWLC